MNTGNFSLVSFSCFHYSEIKTMFLVHFTVPDEIWFFFFICI